MKILIYTHAFTPKVGGVETLVMLLSQGLTGRAEQEDKKAEVTVLTRTPLDGFDDGLLPFRVVRQPNLWRLVRLMRKADIVHLAGPCLIPMFMGLLLRKPTVVEHHGFQTACPNGLLLYEPTQMPCPGHFMARRHFECLRCNAKLGKLHSFKMWVLTFLRRWLCHLMSVNIALTHWLAEALKLPSTTTVYCGIPDNSDEPVRRTLGVPLTFAFLGRLVKTKGVHTLLEAAHRLRAKELSFRLSIIGDGPERLSLEAQAKALHLNDHVTFTGYLPEPELEQTLSHVAAVIMPSLAGETFGLVAAENMVRGRLLIVSEIGVLSEVVGNAGLKFPPGDVNALSNCLEQVLEHPELIPELGIRARDRALELFRHERMVEKHHQVYEQLLKN